MRALFSMLLLTCAFATQAQVICGVSGSHVGRIEAALLQRPIELDPQSGAGSLVIARDGQFARVSDQAFEFYKQGLADFYLFSYVEAIRSFNMAVRENPEFVLAYLGLARAYLAIQGTESAQLAANTAVIYGTGTGAVLTPLEKAWLNSVVAHVLDKSGAQDGALLDLGASDPEVLVYLYELSSEKKLLKALAQNPAHVGVHHFLEHVYEFQGNYAFAQEHGLKVIAAAPNSWHAQHMLGHTLPMLGKWEEAEVQFARADQLSRAWFLKENVAWDQEWHFAHNLELYAMAANKLGHKQKAEALLKDKCSIATASENCVDLIDFYLTEQKFAAAEAVLNSKPDLAATSKGTVFDAFWAEVKFNSGDIARAEALTDAVANNLNPNSRGELRKMAVILIDAIRNSPSTAEQKLVGEAVEKGLAGKSFDTWSENLMAAKRIAAAAQVKGLTSLSQRLVLAIRKIDPDFT